MRCFILFLFASTLLCGATSARAGTFQWANTTGNWSDPAQWGGVAPSGLDPTDVLVFGGNNAFLYTARNDLVPVPAVFNQLVFNSTDNSSGNWHILDDGSIALGGTNSQLVQNNSGAFQLNLPIELRAPLTLVGNGSGIVTLNFPISGAFDITKNGSSTFRFGPPTVPPLGPAANTWMGGLTINGGTIRFNADLGVARTALRANPVTLNAPTALLTTSSELRLGTLSGNSGLVESRVIQANSDSEDIVIHMLSDGTYGGTLRLGPSTGSGKDRGTLIIRGAGTQILTGMFVASDSPPGANALQIQKDVAIGHSATLSLAGNASLAQQGAAGAIVMNGGTFQIDNAVTNNSNRLRDGDSGSTGVDTIGGGLFSLIGNALGTSELIARLQLGSPSNARAGALTLRVVHNAGSSAATELILQSLSRDGFVPTFPTVDFNAVNGAGAELALGQSGAAPRISFATPPPLANGLLRNTRSFNEAMVGWATVNGSSFATHGVNGIAPVPLTPAPAGSTAGDPTANIEVLDSFTATNTAGYAINSLRIQPVTDGQSFVINTAGHLNTNAVLLAGTRDYTISSNGGGGLGGVGTTGAAARYIHVESATLTISARIDPSSLSLVKAGAGTLVLTNPVNANLFSPVVINSGALRATPGSTLPSGELRFRGGVLEITGGGTFTRSIGPGAGNVNWSGFDEFNNPVGEDQGSGGFAAVGADATIDLNGIGVHTIAWEDDGFVNSGHALIFGSANADHRITWLEDSLSLSANQGTANYNAREIRVIDNPASSTDSARFNGPIDGTALNDLLKTGNGTLELMSHNSYHGATRVHEGTLLVNSPGNISNSFLVEVGNGATLGGDGEVGALKVLGGGRIAPGSSVSNTGILSTGYLRLDGAGAQVSVQLGGTVPGANYDQLNVTGAVALNGGDLAGSLMTGFVPALNDLFFIVINDGTEPVDGTFAEGGLVFFDAFPFEIGYAGNSQTSSFTGGNDVVLRAIPEPVTSALVLGAAPLTLLQRRRFRSFPYSASSTNSPTRRNFA